MADNIGGNNNGNNNIGTNITPDPNGVNNNIVSGQIQNNIQNNLNDVKKLREDLLNLQRAAQNFNLNLDTQQIQNLNTVIGNLVKNFDNSVSEIENRAKNININFGSGNLEQQIKQQIDPIINSINKLFENSFNSINVANQFQQINNDIRDQLSSIVKNTSNALNFNSVEEQANQLVKVVKNTSSEISRLVGEINTYRFQGFDTQIVSQDLKGLTGALQNTQKELFDFYRSFNNSDMLKGDFGNFFPNLLNQLKTNIPNGIKELKSLIEGESFNIKGDQFQGKFTQVFSDTAEAINKSYEQIEKVIKDNSGKFNSVEITAVNNYIETLKNASSTMKIMQQDVEISSGKTNDVVKNAMVNLQSQYNSNSINSNVESNAIFRSQLGQLDNSTTEYYKNLEKQLGINNIGSYSSYINTMSSQVGTIEKRVFEVEDSSDKKGNINTQGILSTVRTLEVLIKQFEDSKKRMLIEIEKGLIGDDLERQKAQNNLKELLKMQDEISKKSLSLGENTRVSSKNQYNMMNKDEKDLVNSVYGNLSNTRRSSNELFRLSELLDITPDNVNDLKETNNKLKEMQDNFDKISGKSKTALEIMKNGVSDLLSPLNSVNKIMSAVGLVGLPITLGGIASFGSKTLDYYNITQKQIMESTLDEYGMGNVTDINAARSRMYETGLRKFKETNGLIGYEEYNKSYLNLARNVGGQYGKSDEESIKDLQVINENIFDISKLYKVSESTQAEFVKTFYKELNISGKETSDTFAKVAQAAISSNVPVDTYMKTISSLAMQFRGVGLNGNEAINAMENVMSRGMTFQDAQGFASNTSSAVSKFANDYGKSAFYGVMAGQASNPFQSISQGIEKWSLDENGNFITKSGYGSMMAERMDTELNLRASLSGGDKDVRTKLVYDTWKEQGYNDTQASQLTFLYNRGDRNQLSSYLEKNKPGESEVENLQRQANEKLKDVAEQMPGLQKAMAQLTAAQIETAGKFDSTIKEFYSNMEELVGNLMKTVDKITTSLNKFTDGPIGKIGGTLLDTAAKNPVEFLAGGLTAYAGTKLLSKYASGKIGAKFIGSEINKATTSVAGSGSSTANSLSKTSPFFKSAIGKTGIIAGTAAALYGGYKWLTSDKENNYQPTINDTVYKEDNLLYKKVSAIYDLLDERLGYSSIGGSNIPNSYHSRSNNASNNQNYNENINKDANNVIDMVNGKPRGNPDNKNLNMFEDSLGFQAAGLATTIGGAYIAGKTIPKIASYSRGFDQAIQGNKAVSQIAKIARVAGPVQVASDIISNMYDPIAHSVQGDSVQGDYTKGLTGAATDLSITGSGALIGGIIGSVVPVLGTAVGAAAGAAVAGLGSMVYNWATKDSAGKGQIDKFKDTVNEFFGGESDLEINNRRAKKNFYGISDERYNQAISNKNDPLYNVVTNQGNTDLSDIQGSLYKILSTDDQALLNLSKDNEGYKNNDNLKLYLNSKDTLYNKVAQDYFKEKFGHIKGKNTLQMAQDYQFIKHGGSQWDTNMGGLEYTAYDKEIQKRIQSEEQKLYKEREQLVNESVKKLIEDTKDGKISTLEKLTTSNNISTDSKVVLSNIETKIGQLQNAGVISQQLYQPNGATEWNEWKDYWANNIASPEEKNIMGFTGPLNTEQTMQRDIIARKRNMWITDLNKDLAGVNVDNYDIGSLSAKYESGGKLDAGAGKNDKKDSNNHGAYGKYQFNTEYSVAPFMSWMKENTYDINAYYKKYFDNTTDQNTEYYDSEGFKEKWRKFSQNDPEVFNQLQDKFAQSQYYHGITAGYPTGVIPELQKKVNFDPDKHSNALKEAMFSTSIQHGSGTAANWVAGILKKNPNETDENIIKQLYQKRKEQYPADWKRRYEPELQDALALLKEEGQLSEQGKLDKYGQGPISEENVAQNLIKSTLGSETNPFMRGTMLSGIIPTLGSSYFGGDSNNKVNYLGIMKDLLNAGGDQVTTNFNTQSQARTMRKIMDSTQSQISSSGLDIDRFGEVIGSRSESSYRTIYDSSKNNLYNRPDISTDIIKDGLKQANININVSKDMGKEDLEGLRKVIESYLKDKKFDVRIEQSEQRIKNIEKTQERANNTIGTLR